MTLPIGFQGAVAPAAPRADAAPERAEDSGAGFAVALLSWMQGPPCPETVVPREGAAGSPAREGVGDELHPSPAFAGVPAAPDPPVVAAPPRPWVFEPRLDPRPGLAEAPSAPLAPERLETLAPPRVAATPVPMAPARPETPIPSAPVVLAAPAPAMPMVPAREETPAESPRRALEGAVAAPVPPARPREEASGQGGEGGERGERRGASALLRASRRAARLPAAGVSAREFAPGGGLAATPRAGPGAGFESAPTVAGVASPSLEAWDARLSGARAPGDSVALRFENADGASGTLRLRLQGETLHARVVTADPALAVRLERDLDVLQQSLRERGFSSAQVEVRTPAASESSRGSSDTRRDSERAPRQHERGSGGDGEARRGSRDRQSESR